MKSRVEGHEHLYKDPETGMIVNRAGLERDRYRIAKKQALETQASQQELARLSNEIDEIKSLLHQILNK